MTIYMNMTYLLSAVGFILGLKFMASPSKAKLGNTVSAIAMTLAIAATIYWYATENVTYVNGLLVLGLLAFGSLIGRFLSKSFAMTQMPELISLFNAFGGLCAMIIGINEAFLKDVSRLFLVDKTILLLGIVLGAASFTGSIIAYFKLSGRFKWSIHSRVYAVLTMTLIIVLPFFHLFVPGSFSFLSLVFILGGLALLYGVLFALPIGGADMPVLISILNAVTGVALSLIHI